MAKHDTDIRSYRTENAKRRRAGKPTLSRREAAPRKTTLRKKRTRTAGGRVYLVQDRETFGAIIDDIIENQYAGNRDLAAKESGLPHTTLRRYHEKRGPSIRHQTLEKLRALVGRAGAKALERAMLSPIARDALAEYDAWISKETRWITFGGARSSRLSTAQGGYQWESEVAAGADRGERLVKLIRSLRRRFPASWEPLNSRFAKSGHFRSRGHLAELRVVAPLLDCEDTWEIERSVFELCDKDLERFIKAGAVREAILLDRETDIRRAQQEASRLDRLFEHVF